MAIARGTKPQAPPPAVVFEALTQPHRDPTREWLRLEEDEVEPMILEAVATHRVVWSSLWPEYSSATITFEVTPHESGSKLTWSLAAEPPILDAEIVRILRYRINELINRDMRNVLFDC